MAVGPEHGESASVIEWGAAPLLFHITPRGAPWHRIPAGSPLHHLCLPQDCLLGCKHALVFLRQRKSSLKPRGLSGCSFIFSFLFTGRSLKGPFVPTPTVPSASQGCQDVSHHPGSPALAPPFPYPSALTSRSPGAPSSASALPACGAAPSLHCCPTRFSSRALVKLFILMSKTLLTSQLSFPPALLSSW